MLRKLIAPALAASLLLAACNESPTGAAAEDTELAADDYALVMFGEAGSALEGTMGPMDQARPFDGGSAFHRLPERLRLTEEQVAAIRALREAFRTEHAEEIEALRAIFQAARAAREEGATREEVRAILAEGRPIAMGLHEAVHELHHAIWEVLTDAQRAWLRLHHRMRQLPPPIANG